MMFDQKEYNRDWRSTHRDEIREYNKQYQIDHREQIGVQRQQYRREHGSLPMAENRSCTLFLGVHIAEQVLSQLFKNVVRMPNNNPGFDFSCANGYMVDCKASCCQMSPAGTSCWNYHIRHNPIADFFLCMAFDNREDLNPLHVWLIPGKVLSHLTNASISETTLDKWAEYEKPLDKVMACCDVMRGDYATSG